MKEFTGKHIVVTGGVKGIGRACVDIFVREGGQVSVLDIDPAGQRLEDESGGVIGFMLCDVASFHAIEGSISKAIQRFGEIDVLVNNAGVNRYATVTETTICFPVNSFICDTPVSVL